MLISPLCLSDLANYDWAVAVNRQCLDMIGLWPRDTFGLRRFLENLYVMTIVLAITVFLAIPSYRLLLRQQEYISIIDNFGLPIAYTSIILKIFVLHTRRNGECLNSMNIRENYYKGTL